MFSLVLMLLAVSPAELNERFARGVRAFEDGRVTDARREFQALEAIEPNSTVRFNLAQCDATLGMPVEAVALLDGLVSDGTLAPGRLIEAERLRQAQRALIGTLRLETSEGTLEGVVSIDGVDRSTSLPATVSVNPGPHNVMVQVAGFFPATSVVGVGAGATTVHPVALTRSARPAARLRIRSVIPGVAVFVDDVEVARTPVLTALQLAPGRRNIEARRAGYESWMRTVVLAEGAEEVLVLDLGEPVAVESTVTLHPSEPLARVQLDGRVVAADQPTPTAVGPHEVVVERDGFFPARASLDLSPGASRHELQLEPTPSTLADLYAKRSALRLGGGLAVGVGGAAALASGVVVVVHAKALGDLTAVFNRTLEPCQRGDSESCRALGDTAPQLTRAQTIQLVALISGAVGLAIGIGGSIALGQQPELSRYDRPTLLFGVGPAGLSLSGKF